MKTAALEEFVIDGIQDLLSLSIYALLNIRNSNEGDFTTKFLEDFDF